MNTVDNENDKRPIRDCRQKKRKTKVHQSKPQQPNLTED